MPEFCFITAGCPKFSSTKPYLHRTVARQDMIIGVHVHCFDRNVESPLSSIPDSAAVAEFETPKSIKSPA